MSYPHFPCEMCKNFVLRDDCEWRTVCRDSLEAPRDECPPSGVCAFKNSDPPLKLCSIHGAIKKCPNPYHQTGKLLVVSPDILSGAAMFETLEWPESGLPKLYDAFVKDGVNAARYFSYCMPGDPWDPLVYYDFAHPDYLWVIKRRLTLMKERELTAIFILQPYRGSITDDEARWLIRELKPFLPNIIFEPTNEPGPPEVGRLIQLAEILLEEGIPKKNILIEFAHSGEWADFMLAGMKDGATVCHHWMGSMATVIDNMNGAAAQQILSWGTFLGSNDGQDDKNDCHGLNFRYLEEHDPPIENNRPNNQELQTITAWMLAHGRGYEHLSAASYRRPTVNGLSWPNLEDAIELGRGERLAMKAAAGW